MSRAPDVKALLLAHLPPLVGAPTVSTRPDDGTKRFVRVIATGGPGRRERHLMTVQLTIDCYAPTAGLAAQLAAAVDEAMHALPTSDIPVAAVPWSTTPMDYPDPDTGSARYTATYQVVVKCL